MAYVGSMAVYWWKYVFCLLLLHYCIVQCYLVKNHPCCQDGGDNITLAMVIDAFEIYGHDPTIKLDFLLHYQNQMIKIRNATNQFVINEHVHVATDHLARFIQLHIKELKVLLIAIDDVIDNMLTMYENHNSIKAERVATFNQPVGGVVPVEFYVSQEFYCGRNVYIFLSELYSDIYNFGKGTTPFCKGKSFHFLGFVHFLDESRYFLEEDPSLVFQMDNYMHGLECHLGICIYRFPYKKTLQNVRDIAILPKAIVKCGLVLYKLPPLSAVSCIITSGSFILDFNIQGIRFRHHDYLLTLPNGATYYTKEDYSPLACNHHVCEWNNTNFYGGPFTIPGDPGNNLSPVPPWLEQTTLPPAFTSPKPRSNDVPINEITYTLDGCWFTTPPNYGSIAGISYLDTLGINEGRFTCQGTRNQGLYWYPQWMGIPPQHPYPQSGDMPSAPPENPYYPHQVNPQVPVVAPAINHSK